MRQRKLKGLDEKLGVYSGGVRIEPTAQRGRWSEFFQKEQPIYMELGCGKGQFILSLAKAYPERNFIAVEGNQSVMLRALQKAARFFCRFEPSQLLSEDGNERPFEEVVQRGIFAVINTPGEECGEAEGIEGVDGFEKSGSADEAENAAKNGAPGEAGESGTVVEAEKIGSAGEAGEDRSSDGAGESGSQGRKAPETEDLGSIYAVAPNLIFANMYVREVTDVFAENELSGIYLNFSDPWPKERHAKRRLTHTRYLKGYERVLRQGSALEFKTDNEGLFRFSIEEFDANGLVKEEYSENLHASEYESKNFMTEYEEKFSSRGNPIYYCRIRYE